MIKLNIDNIKDDKHKDGIILFAQAFFECTFKYSFESYRAPALNLYFLFYDIKSTMHLVEDKIINQGNLKPLYEELFAEFEYDIVANDIGISSDVFLSFKNIDGHFFTNDSIDKISYKKIMDSISYCIEAFNNYLNVIITKIKSLIFCENENDVNYAEIIKLARCLATQLINIGFSKEYLHESANTVFFHRNTIIENEILFNEFFDNILTDKPEYTICFGITTKTYNNIKNILNCKFSPLSNEEKKKFNMQKGGYSCEFENVKANDMYSAIEEVNKILSNIISMLKLSKHTSNIFISNKAKVLSTTSQTPIYVNTKNKAMNITPDSTDDNTLKNINSIITNLGNIPQPFFKMIELHSTALNNNDKINQLLNLWTIIEIFVEVDIKETDKITQITNSLISVSTTNYIHSLLTELLKDIHNYDNELLNLINDNVEICEDVYQKFIAILCLSEYDNVYDDILSKLNETPLIKYRVELYKKEILTNSDTVIKYIERHSQRLRWHIMRIYRNRNMIVHDGDYMPYLDTIIENLHYYVDNVFATIISHFKQDIFNLNTILISSKNNEYLYYKKLGKDFSKKRKNTIINFDKDNFIDLIIGDAETIQKFKEEPQNDRN